MTLDSSLAAESGSTLTTESGATLTAESGASLEGASGTEEGEESTKPKRGTYLIQQIFLVFSSSNEISHDSIK